MIVFCHMVKTAGTTINYIFRNNFGINYVNVYTITGKKDFLGRELCTKDDLSYFLKRNKLIKCISGHSVRPYSDLGYNKYDLKYITFLRDPVTRYLSHYNHHKVHQKKSKCLKEWLEEKNENNVPLTFELKQNYPNPFNPSTKITYSIPEAGNVKVSVYNLVGEEVAELVNGYSESGFFEVSFNASDLPSGTYIYTLQSAGSVQTRKMILLK